MTRMKLPCLAGCLLLFGAGGLLASVEVTLQLLNPPNSGGTGGGVYTSPYNIGVNPYPSTTLTTVATQLVCDDYLNDITLGEHWNAYVSGPLTTLDSGNVSPLLFGSSSTTPTGAKSVYSDISEDYALAAYLTAELMALPSSDSPAGEELSFAIWNVFDTSVGNPSGISATKTATQYLSDAETAVQNAVAADGSVDLSKLSVGGESIASLTVYTPTPDTTGNTGQNQGGSSVQQEFLQVAMPEPSSPAVLALDLLAALGLIVAFRRRMLRKAN